MGVPDGAVRRLINHYGEAVTAWLHEADSVIARAAERWKVHLTHYHDAGWSSVVAVGVDWHGRRVAIKALPETDRYTRERAALTHWRDNAPVAGLLDFDDRHQLLLLTLVAGAAGGAERPRDHAERTAANIAALHRVEPLPLIPVPLLADYYRDTVLPRIERRAHRFGDGFDRRAIRRAITVGHELASSPSRRAMLHADLYAENVLFDERRQPVFIDPHPRVGSPAFDWAFWCVYYISTEGFATRTEICRRYVPDLYDEVVAWSLTLAVDGGLYYLDSGDDRIAYMRSLLTSRQLRSLLAGARA